MTNNLRRNKLFNTDRASVSQIEYDMLIQAKTQRVKNGTKVTVNSKVLLKRFGVLYLAKI